MDTVRIGVKYCGGCREQYNRKAEFEKVRNGLLDAGVEFMRTEDEGVYDALLVLYGCPTRCADISQYRTGRIVMIDGKDGYLRARTELSGTLNNKV